MSFGQLERIVAAAKNLQGGVMDSDPTAQWYESSRSFSFAMPGCRVWTQEDLLYANPAANQAAAQANCAGPLAGVVQDISAFVDAIRLTPILSVNNTYIALSVYGDFSSIWYDNWLKPQFVPQLSGLPSFGYTARLYDGDPNAGGVEVMTTDGTTGTGINKSVAWIWNYDNGMLLLADDFAVADPWILGFRYIGETAGGDTSSDKIFTYSFTNQTAITVAHNLGTKRILSYLADDGTNDFEITGLASTWEYTDDNTIDITFGIPTSGIVVVGLFESEIFYGDYPSSVAVSHEHAFNQNHAYTTFDPLSFDDLRFALFNYTFNGAYEDLSTWVASRVAEFGLVAGLSRRFMQTFNNSTTWVVEHNLDTKFVFLSVQGIGAAKGLDIYSMANSVQRNQNDVTITWATPQSGRVMVGTR